METTCVLGVMNDTIILKLLIIRFLPCQSSVKPHFIDRKDYEDFIALKSKNIISVNVSSSSRGGRSNEEAETLLVNQVVWIGL